MAARLSSDAWLVGLAALVPRLAMALAFAGTPPAADGSFYHRIAERVAQGHGYTWAWPDGTVTYAAHYPVGYPALLAPAYALFGAHAVVAMIVNALVGVVAAVAVERMLRARGRRVALAGGLLVALHPGLVAYTPALMTEGVTAALWAAAVWAADRARVRGWPWVALTGAIVGVSTLVRPQSLLLAPLLGAALDRGAARRARAALLCTAVAIACCLPWTARNCARMDRCALVSMNGGWNLLIGTQPEGRGGWSELQVPEACRAVYDEAGKDVCFERAARERIVEAPGAWLALAPAKLAATFDYCGAAGWYLHEADPAAFGAGAKVALGIVETAFERVVLLLALIATWRVANRANSGADRPGLRTRAKRAPSWRERMGRPRWVRHVLLAAGLAGAFGVRATVAYGALAALALWRPRRPMTAVGLAAAIAVVGSFHAVFFGGGRYQLPLWPLLCAAAAPSLVRSPRALSRWLRSRSRRARIAAASERASTRATGQ
jgi:hypothetical protein